MSELIADLGDYLYPSNDGGPAARRMRLWRVEPGVLVAVLTERHDDPGTSITNAAADICLQLERAYPTDLVRVVEHYPDNHPGTRYSWVALDAHQRPQWRHLDDAAARALLPGLEDA